MQPIAKLALFATLSFLLAPIGHANASSCTPDGSPAVGIVTISLGDPSTTYYVEQRSLGPPTVWQESNGIEGLQDGCGDPHPTPDTQLF